MDVDVDLADALERYPVKRVLIEQFARARRLDVAASEAGTVRLEQANVLVRENNGRVLARPYRAKIAFTELAAGRSRCIRPVTRVADVAGRLAYDSWLRWARHEQVATSGGSVLSAGKTAGSRRRNSPPRPV